MGRCVFMPSAVIQSFVYHPGQKALEVRFTTGRCYIYHDVPAEAVEAFRRSRSKGRHFNTRIRGRYGFSRLQEAEGPPVRRR